MKIVKKIMSLMLGGIIIFSSVSVSASEKVSKVEVEDVVQDAIDTSGMEATAVKVSEEESSSLWENNVAQKESTRNLLQNLQEEKYQEIEVEEPLAVEIEDEEDKNSVYYLFKGYKNDKKETVVAMFIYEPSSDEMLLTTAEKITNDSNMETYYEESNRDISLMSGKFNTISFLCGLSGTVACGSFSAMLFAFVPASIAVGMTCSTAFAYVCSYA